MYLWTYGVPGRLRRCRCHWWSIPDDSRPGWEKRSYPCPRNSRRSGRSRPSWTSSCRTCACHHWHSGQGTGWCGTLEHRTLKHWISEINTGIYIHVGVSIYMLARKYILKPRNLMRWKKLLILHRNRSVFCSILYLSERFVIYKNKKIA